MPGALQGLHKLLDFSGCILQVHELQRKLGGGFFRQSVLTLGEETLLRSFLHVLERLQYGRTAGSQQELGRAIGSDQDIRVGTDVFQDRDGIDELMIDMELFIVPRLSGDILDLGNLQTGLFGFFAETLLGIHAIVVRLVGLDRGTESVVESAHRRFRLVAFHRHLKLLADDILHLVERLLRAVFLDKESLSELVVILQLFLGHLFLLLRVRGEREESVGFRLAHEERRIGRIEILDLGVFELHLILERIGIERNQMVRDLLEHRFDSGLRFAVRQDHVRARQHRHLLHADHGADRLFQIGETESGGREINVLVFGVKFRGKLPVLLEHRQSMDHFGDFLVACLDIQDIGGLQQDGGLERGIFVQGLHALRGQSVCGGADQGGGLPGAAHIAVGDLVSQHGAVLGAHADVPAEQQRSVHARREEPYERDDDDSGKNGKSDFSVLHQHVVHFLNDHGDIRPLLVQ